MAGAVQRGMVEAQAREALGQNSTCPQCQSRLRRNVQNGTVLADCKPRHRVDPSTFAIRCIERNGLFKVLEAY